MATFGKYRLIQRIGAGGMAEIFLARHCGAEGLEKTLVLKRIRPEFARRPRFVSRFIDEARIAVSLNHPNIVQVYEFGRVEREYYLAMEYVEGVDLGRVLRHTMSAGAPMPLGEAVGVIVEVAKALDYAHRKRDAYGAPLDIVHRDVSPQNILISRDGVVKLVDFGIAHATTIAQPQASSGGEIEGKLSYMSPEQARGDAVDARSDLFALGVVLWELLANAPLFPSKPRSATLRAVRNAVIPPLSAARPDLPESLARLVHDTLAREPDARTSSARDLQIALTRWLFEARILTDSVTLASYVAGLALAPDATPAPVSSLSDPDALPQRALTDELRTLPTQPGAHNNNPPARAHTQPLAPPPAPSALSASLTPPMGLARNVEAAHAQAGAALAGLTPVSALHAEHPHAAAAHATDPGDDAMPRTERTGVVLVCGDVRGFQALREAIGVDAWRQLVLDSIRLVEALAFKTDALVARVGVEGWMLVLGLPISSENDAERAVQLARALLEATEAMNSNLASPLVLSVGVAVGSVRVTRGRPANTPLDWSFDPQEDDLGGALRAEAFAKAAMGREVLVDARVAQRAGASFRFESVAPVAVAQPPNDDPDVSRCPDPAPERAASRLIGPVPAHERLRASTLQPHRVLGREIALKHLRRVYRDVRLERRAQATLVLGEQGIGKSTLAHAFMEGVVASSGVRRWRVALELRDQERVYGALIRVLREVLDIRRDLDPRLARERLTRMVRVLLTDLDAAADAKARAALAFILNIKLDADDQDAQGDLERLDPRDRRARLTWALRALLTRIAARRPALFLIEDFHHCDPSSLAFFAACLRDGADMPVLFIFTALASQLDRAAPGWKALLDVSALHVEPLPELDARAARALAVAHLPDALAGHEAVVQAAVERAGGNPSYLKALIDALVASLTPPLSPDDALALLQPAEPADPDALLPATVEGLIACRLDRLPDGPRSTLQRVALLGARFVLPEVFALLGIEDDAAAQARVRAHLGTLVDEGLIARVSATDSLDQAAQAAAFNSAAAANARDTPAAAPDARAWAFANTALVSVAARGVVDAERRDLHGRVAAYLTARRASNAPIDAAEIARHLDAAGRSDASGAMFTQAAHEALDSVGGDECLRLIDEALARIDPNTPQAVEALELKERALALLGRPQEREALLDDLLIRLNAIDAPETQRARARLRQAQLCYERGDLERAEAMADQLTERAHALGDPELRAEARMLSARILRDTGRNANSSGVLTGLLDLLQRGDAPSVSPEVRWRLWIERGLTALRDDRVHDALAHTQRALDVAERHGARRHLQHTHAKLARLHARLGRLDDALAHNARALSSARALGDARDQGALLIDQGYLYRVAGELDRARRALLDGIPLTRKSRDRATLAEGLIQLGLVHLDRGHIREAHATLKKGHRLASAVHNVELVGRALLALAQSAAVAAEGAPASDAPTRWTVAFERAQLSLQHATRADLRHLRAHSASQVGLALLRLGHTAQALRYSRQALTLLTPDAPPIEDLRVLAHHATIAASASPDADEAPRASAQARAMLEAHLVSVQHPSMRRAFLRSPLVRRAFDATASARR